MKRGIFLGTLVLLLFFSSSPVFSAQILTRPTGENVWEMYARGGDPVGTLKKTEANSYSIYDISGRFIGLIYQSGTWMPWNAKKRLTTITPEEAKFYLDALGAIKTIK